MTVPTRRDNILRLVCETAPDGTITVAHTTALYKHVYTAMEAVGHPKPAPTMNKLHKAAAATDGKTFIITQRVVFFAHPPAEPDAPRAVGQQIMTKAGGAKQGGGKKRGGKKRGPKPAQKRSRRSSSSSGGSSDEGSGGSSDEGSSDST